MNQQTANGHFNQLKGKIVEKWAEVVDDDIAHLEGKRDLLIGKLQHKTGESREAIRDFLDSAERETGSLASQASEAVQHYANAAAETASQAAQQAMDQGRAKAAEAGEVVKRKPLETLAVCFGVGLVTGIVGGLLIQSRR